MKLPQLGYSANSETTQLVPSIFFNGILIGSSLRVPDLPGHGRSACVLVAVCIALLLTGLILIEHWKP